ncbi:hypothetical protein BD770DRAFT_378090 [Pilaira anomala]|nr:hypothetical protein BD770DRAFT_378090 [Pilaira anomala]
MYSNTTPTTTITATKREPMSISSITTNQDCQLPRLSTEPSCNNRMKEARTLPQYNYYHHIAQSRHNLIRSPPTTPEQDQYIHSPPSSPHSFDFSPSSSHHGYREEDEHSINKSGTVTLQERRQRNKAASAKYRQKKNIQQHEMRNMINQISERNALLERQLKEVREENQKLRIDADKLRGKFVAKKLLRQWVDRQKNHRLPLPAQFGNENASYKPNYIDIDLLDEDEDEDLVSLASDI